jgi:SAM-dependent methyltransferase
MNDARADSDPDHDHFDHDWLRLREPADRRARSRDLEQRLIDALQRRPSPWRIHDLGAGSGSNARHLAPRLPGTQHWRLIDHDPRLLAHAREQLAGLRHPGGHSLRFDNDLRSIEDVEARPGGRTDREGSRPLAACDLLTASALLDLVTAPWIDALADLAAEHRPLILITLSVDGRWAFRPQSSSAAREDEDMRALYRAHQQGPKGLGQALGGDAPAHIATALRRRGFDVTTAPSPWQLEGAGDQRLAQALVQGWRYALIEQAPERQRDIDRWADARLAAVDRGTLAVEVGHVDVLALPP